MVAGKSEKQQVIAFIDYENCREILPDDVRSITILLEKSDDDWWYGSY